MKKKLTDQDKRIVMQHLHWAALGTRALYEMSAITERQRNIISDILESIDAEEFGNTQSVFGGEWDKYIGKAIE